MSGEEKPKNFGFSSSIHKKWEGVDVLLTPYSRNRSSIEHRLSSGSNSHTSGQELHIMESEGSLACSKLTTSISSQMNPVCTLISYSFNINFTLLPSMPQYPKKFFPFRFSTKIVHAFLFFSFPSMIHVTISTSFS